MMCGPSTLQRGRRILTVAAAVLLLATLAFIWRNSLRSEAASGVESGRMLAVLKPFLEPLFGRENVTEHRIRKLAHFAEFFALGGELAFLVLLLGRPRIQAVLNVLAAGLFAAVTDEALQLLSGRGPAVADVLLDFSGAAAGAAVVLLVYYLRAALHRRIARRRG